MSILAFIFAIFTVVGVLQGAVGAYLTGRFCAKTWQRPKNRPPVTVMKPLCGVEQMTELALESFFLLDYPVYQLVFGVKDKEDPVLEIVARLQARYPQCDTAVMVNDDLHGSNRKVSNLINMQKLAKHDILVFADADIHVPPYYLDDLVAALEDPKVGLVTTLYTGLPGTLALAGRLGAAQINQTFLPSALLARQLGRQDCMGATMALTKQILKRSGGLAALADHLADDQVLGRLVVKAGYRVGLAHTIPVATVPETDFEALFKHELRWGRTIRALVPFAYAGSILQIPMFWAILSVLFSGFALWSIVLLLLTLAGRIIFARHVEKSLRLPLTREIWFFLLRDLFSFVIYVASFTGRRVDWRGQSMVADSGRPDYG